MLFTVETVSCLGACGLGPVLTVNDKVYLAMTPDAVTALIQELREENPDVEVHFGPEIAHGNGEIGTSR